MDAAERATRAVVDDNEILYRGIVIDEGLEVSRQITFDQKRQKYRLSSAAFGGIDISVDLASKTTPLETLQRLPLSRALAQVMAIEPKSIGYDVVEDPKDDPNDYNPAHALICVKEEITTASKRKTLARQLAQKCQWIIPPEDCDMIEPVIGENS